MFLNIDGSALTGTKWKFKKNIYIHARWYLILTPGSPPFLGSTMGHCIHYGTLDGAILLLISMLSQLILNNMTLDRAILFFTPYLASLTLNVKTECGRGDWLDCILVSHGWPTATAVPWWPSHVWAIRWWFSPNYGAYLAGVSCSNKSTTTVLTTTPKNTQISLKWGDKSYGVKTF